MRPLTAAITLAAVALIVVAAILLRKRAARVETWGDNELRKDLEELVEKAAGSGMPLQRFLDENEWIQNFKREQVFEVFERAREGANRARKKQLKLGGTRDEYWANVTALCGARKREPCPENSPLKYQRPCRNKSGDKCCGADGKNCIPFAGTEQDEAWWAANTRTDFASAAK